MAEKRAEATADRQESRQQEQGRQQANAGREQQLQSQDRPQQQGGLTRRQPTLMASPFALLERLADEMASVFDRAGRGVQRPAASDTAATLATWEPDVDVFQRGNELVIRADLPGLNADDVVVEVSDDAVTISGERRQEREEDRGDVYRYERSYGAFLRVIPLPEGAIADQAKATFRDGVLEITVPAPSEQVSRGRRLEIGQGSESGSDASQARQSTQQETSQSGQSAQPRQGTQGNQDQGRR